MSTDGKIHVIPRTPPAREFPSPELKAQLEELKRELTEGAPWGMGFELFARLVANAHAANITTGLTDADMERAAVTARRAVQVWRASREKKPEGRP